MYMEFIFKMEKSTSARKQKTDTPTAIWLVVLRGFHRPPHARKNPQRTEDRHTARTGCRN